jgi:hypothetical protein
MRFLSFAAALAVAAGLSGPPTMAGGVLTVGNPFAPISMDPALSGNGRAGTFMMPAYEPLVRTRSSATASRSPRRRRKNRSNIGLARKDRSRPISRR